MLEDMAHMVHAHDGGAAPSRRRCSHGAPVTQSPDPSFSMVLGCHGSCFTNYPRGHEPTLCPHYLYAVCIVCEIIFQVCAQTRNSCTDDSHLTNPGTPGKYGSSWEPEQEQQWVSCYWADMGKRVVRQWCYVTLEHGYKET